jgi:alkylation response protein AidB-like acyl-CoA dehydrogenase
MTQHTTPADDLVFGLTRLFDLPGLTGGSLGTDDIAAILGEAEKFSREVLFAGSREADKHGAKYENGVVRLPPSYQAAYKGWVEAGWQGISGPEEYGGQGLPPSMWVAVQELAGAADMAFMLCPLLTGGAIEALTRFGTEDQKQRWLPKMVNGEWTGSMNLTEPQAGSDLSAVRTRAEPLGPDGSGISKYALHGQKIYITFGEHDLTPNTIHLVLARLPDAPPGTRGISLFAAPKVLPNGQRNAVRCGGIEHKLGIHASPTCVMLFEGAEAEMVGEPNKGLNAMFAMMNDARLNVGLQGVAQGARAVELAEAYAAQRIQGGQPISRHPDVARMLAEMRAITLAGRFMVLEAAHCIDQGRLNHDNKAESRLALLIPIVKAWCTDRGVEVASLGIQVHGGMGFVEDTGAAQIMRDARIAPIYEGTNGIQAIDLVQRKLFRDGGAEMRALLAEVRATDPALHAATDALLAATDWMLANAARPDAAQASAVAYLDAAGWLLGGWELARAAKLDARYATLANFYLRRLLPRAAARLAEIEAADAVLDLLGAA